MILDSFRFQPKPNSTVNETIQQLEACGFKRVHGSMEDVKKVRPDLYRKGETDPGLERSVFTSYRDCAWYKPWSLWAMLYVLFVFLLLLIPTVFPILMFVFGFLNCFSWPDVAFYMIGAFSSPIIVVALMGMRAVASQLQRIIFILSGKFPQHQDTLIHFTDGNRKLQRR